MAGQVNKRKDKDRIVLRKGESQRKDGNYDYRWTPEMANAILCMLRHWKNCVQRKMKFCVINVMA